MWGPVKYCDLEILWPLHIMTSWIYDLSYLYISVDLSSASDSENDSEDSDGLTGYRCQNCLVTGEYPSNSTLVTVS